MEFAAMEVDSSHALARPFLTFELLFEDMPNAFATLLPPQLQDPTLLAEFCMPDPYADVFFVTGPSHITRPAHLIYHFFMQVTQMQGDSDPFCFAYHMVSRVGVALDVLAAGGLRLSRANLTGVLIGVLTVLYKSIDDHHLTNTDITKAFQELVTLQKLNKIEVHVFLLLMKAPNTRLLFTL